MGFPRSPSRRNSLTTARVFRQDQLRRAVIPQKGGPDIDENTARQRNQDRREIIDTQRDQRFVSAEQAKQGHSENAAYCRT